MIGAERQKYLLLRGDLFVMVDLNAELVASDLDPAFQQVSQIDGVDHLAFEQIAVGDIGRPLEVDRNVFRPQAGRATGPLNRKPVAIGNFVSKRAALSRNAPMPGRPLRWRLLRR